jgi:hypothetical protein
MMARSRWAPLAFGFALGATACALPPQQPQDHDAAPRAIAVSIDGLNEAILRRTLTPADAPALFGIFDTGICADHAVTAFPSVTAPSHATLWTGAYGDVTGIAANSQPPLPRSEHTLLDRISGFDSAMLSAEPLWITGGREGRRVAGHHVTQAPGAPGYPGIDGPRSSGQREARAAAEEHLGLETVSVMNGYNRQLAPHRLVTARDVEWDDASTWHLDPGFSSGVPPRAFSWRLFGDVVMYGLLHGDADRYDAVTLSTDRGVEGAVTARAVPVENAHPTGRPLARHFSDAIEIGVDGGRTYFYGRLFGVAADGADFELYHPSMHVVEANRSELQAAYDRAVRGWVGNSALNLFRDGTFGRRMTDGGGGMAEARYLETAELMTRQFKRGSTWLWENVEPELLLDYFPLGDAVDHTLLGFLDPESPHHDPRANALRTAGWQLVDLRVAHLRDLAISAPGGAFFLTGDHGMRATWRWFAPNAVLREADLLAIDDNGEIDLSRTRALSPNGYWIAVNRTAWQDGIVPPEEEAEVITLAVEALRAARDEAGEPIVTEVFLPAEHPELGLGGPAAGDVYYETAAGYRWSWRADTPISSPADVGAGHGFPSTSPDMYTAFCAVGVGAGPRRIGDVRSVTVAPTVAEWIGMDPPADAVGESVLPRMRD